MTERPELGIVRLRAVQRELNSRLTRGFLGGTALFDPAEVNELFKEYSQMVARLKQAAPEVFDGIHERPMPPVEVKEQGRRIARHHLEQLLRDVESAIEIASWNQTSAQRAKATATPELPQMKSPASVGRRVFIGHGRSDQWLRLEKFLAARLRLECEEFNREPAAGLTTVERLNQMLQTSCFAFLIMTAEDEHSDGSRHARENVVHEVGLFQGRYGFRRAIVLLEEGCAEFSNISGLGQIRFPKGDVLAKSDEIRHVLEREGLLNM